MRPPVFPSLPRILLETAYLDQGALPRFERSPSDVSVYIHGLSNVPAICVEAEELFIPTIEIGASAAVVAVGKRTSTAHYVQEFNETQSNLLANEDSMMAALLAACIDEPNPYCSVERSRRDQLRVCTVSGTILRSLSDMMAYMASLRCRIEFLVCSPESWEDILGQQMANSSEKFFTVYDETYASSLVHHAELGQTRFVGRFMDAEILVNPAISAGDIYLTTGECHLGWMPIREDAMIFLGEPTADEPRSAFAYEEIGFGICDSQAVARVSTREVMRAAREKLPSYTNDDTLSKLLAAFPCLQDARIEDLTRAVTATVSALKSTYRPYVSWPSTIGRCVKGMPLFYQKSLVSDEEAMTAHLATFDTV